MIKISTCSSSAGEGLQEYAGRRRRNEVSRVSPAWIVSFREAEAIRFVHVKAAELEKQ